MVNYFHFRSNNHVFTKKLESVQCTGQTKSGAECRKRCLIGTSKCWIHLLSDHKLRIKPATNPAMGLGLFACNGTNDNEFVFREGDLITKYEGETISLDTRRARYGQHTAPYGVEIRKNVEYKDCAVDRCIGGLVNHAPAALANCAFKKHHGVMRIRCKKRIRNNEELFVSYGRSYRFNEPNVTSTTNTRKHY